MLRLSEKIVDELKYFGLYWFAQHMGTNPVRTALVIHRCTEVVWTKTALDDGSVSYEVEAGKKFDLEEEVIPLVGALVM